jgi:SAP domain
MGGVVEDLFWDDLKKCYKMRTYRMTKIKDRETLVPVANSVLDIGKCEYIEGISLEELGNKVFDVDASFVARMKTNEVLIDIAGPYRKVFQVTVSDHHSMSLNGLRKLFKASGHYSEIEGVSEITTSESNIGKISYYWVVPNERESAWKKKAPRRIQTEREKETASEAFERKQFADCLEKYVDQYILVMDNAPLESSTKGSNEMSSLNKNRMTKLKKYTVRELREHCRSLQLKISGNKQALIVRLLPYMGRISKET